MVEQACRSLRIRTTCGRQQLALRPERCRTSHPLTSGLAGLRYPLGAEPWIDMQPGHGREPMSPQHWRNWAHLLVGSPNACRFFSFLFLALLSLRLLKERRGHSKGCHSSLNLWTTRSFVGDLTWAISSAAQYLGICILDSRYR